ncbi:MAG: hypothetical protein ABWJ90_05055 [Thermus sp.]|uniref:hypothetical protein n=1 Tax=Thermus sp. TaxID=275 RepID=UPI00351BEB74
MKEVLMWSVVAALVMFFFPVKFLAVWGSMLVFPFIVVRRLNLAQRESPLVSGLAYGALTGALSRFILALVYILLGSLATTTGAAAGDDLTALAGAAAATAGVIGLFTGTLAGAIVGGIAGMISAGTAPKKST